MQTAIGVISGTSMDAIDVALVRTDGEQAVRTGPARSYPYHRLLREELLAVIDNPYRAEHLPMPELDDAVADAHSNAVMRFMAENAIAREQVDLVGFHGQTVFHAPQHKLTRQLGDGPRLARRLGIPVVWKFRHADVAAGGEGAPFVPLYHRALAAGLQKPLIILNLGGVANITWLDGEGIVAMDTGPASALLDDFVQKRLGKPFDENGALAASGSVNVAVLMKLLDNPFFDRPPPKSLDRNEFHQGAALVEGLSDADGAATLAAFTVEATLKCLPLLASRPGRLLVTGGGRRNSTFMKLFAARLGIPVEPVEAVGWDGDALEAQCFAYLAVRSRRDLPLSLPTTTGVPQPMPGGEWLDAKGNAIARPEPPPVIEEPAEEPPAQD
ncbi:MAG TPA: anhydro-N-acetylmuramic acid kinase [Beijerinckiaceae bacterium]|nr:anhydro-N-acetylmuramic acid kinase [Beijerinckiaceae bacterium]